MLYDISNIELYKKIIKKAKVKMIVSFVTILVILVILGIFTNDDTATIFKIISMVLFVVVGWYELYVLFEEILSSKDKIKMLDSLNRSKQSIYNGKVIEINKPITISKYEKAYVVSFKVEKSVLSCYYSTNFNNMPFEKDKDYNITLAGNIIIDYKELG